MTNCKRFTNCVNNSCTSPRGPFNISWNYWSHFEDSPTDKRKKINTPVINNPVNNNQVIETPGIIQIIQLFIYQFYGIIYSELLLSVLDKCHNFPVCANRVVQKFVENTIAVSII